MKTRAMSVGCCAADILQHAKACKIIAKFTRSMHIAVDGRVICIVDEALGNGPFNITVAPAALKILLHPESGASGLIAQGAIDLGSATLLEFLQSPVWRPNPGLTSGQTVEPLSVRAAIAYGLSSAPPESFFHAAFGHAGAARNGIMDHAARRRIAALCGWLDNPENPPPLSHLIGLGAGLTPAGDDLVGGLLLALHVGSRSDALDFMVKAVQSLPNGITTPLSRQFLDAACTGIGHEWLHDLIDALHVDDIELVLTATEKMHRIGHGSGWDTLAGLLLGFASIIPATRSEFCLMQPENCAA